MKKIYKKEDIEVVGQKKVHVLLFLSNYKLGTTTADGAKNCKSCKAGVAAIYLNEKSNVDGYVLDIDGSIRATFINPAQPEPRFKCYEFEEDTAYWTQTYTTKNKGCNSNIAHKIEFKESCMSIEMWELLTSLQDESCCGMLAIVKDCNGKYWQVGADYDETPGLTAREAFICSKLYLADGTSTTTGVNPENDSNEGVITLNTTTQKWARCIQAGAFPIAA
mgnify:CR=1 FL=1